MSARRLVRPRRVLAAAGLETVLARHTCAHPVNALFDILDELDAGTMTAAAAEVPS